jgi:translation initiation factor 3 subunit B
MENGYHLWDFRGSLLREEHIDKFKQFLWRPRPPTMLSKEEQKRIRKNLREYSKQFDEEDQFELEVANKEVVEARKRQLDEWRAWRSRIEKEVRLERADLGLPEDPEEGLRTADDGEDRVVEEMVEEVISEHEEEVV